MLEKFPTPGRVEQMSLAMSMRRPRTRIVSVVAWKKTMGFMPLQAGLVLLTPVGDGRGIGGWMVPMGGACFFRHGAAR